MMIEYEVTQMKVLNETMCIPPQIDVQFALVIYVMLITQHNKYVIVAPVFTETKHPLSIALTSACKSITQ